MLSPCKGCEERHDLCHSECEKYLEFRRKKDEENAMWQERCQIGYTLHRLHQHGIHSRKQRRSIR